MKTYLLLASFSLFSLSSFGQTEQIDSLKQLLKDYDLSTETSVGADTTAVANLILISSNYSKIEYDSAIHYANKAIDLAEEIQWKRGQADAAFKLGSIYYKVSRDYASAITILKKGLAINLELNKSQLGGPKSCKYYYYLSNCYQYSGDLKQAKKEILVSLQIAEILDNKNYILNAYNVLGTLSRNLYEFDESIDYYSKCLDVIREVNNISLEAILLGNLGLTYDAMGKFPEAIKFVNKAIKIDDSLGLKSGLIRHYGNAANTYRSMGELDKSIELLELGISIAEELNDQYSIGIMLSSLAIAYNVKGNYGLALENNFKSLEISRFFNDVQSELNTLGNIGLDYQYNGNFLLALEYHNKSIALIEEYGLVNNGSALGNIALIYSANGSFEKALDIQLRVLELVEANNDVSNKALTLANIGGIYQAMKVYDKAYDYYSLAFDLSTELNMKSTAANCLSDMGNLALFKKEFDEALMYYERSIEQYEKMDAKYYLSIAYGNVSQVRREMGMFDEAIDAGQIALDNAFASGNPYSKRMSSRNMYWAQYGKQNYDKALASLSLLRKAVADGIELNYLGFSEKERENYFILLEDDMANYYDFGAAHFTQYPAITDTMYNLALSNKGLSLKSSTYIRQSIINSGDSLLIREYDQFILNKKKIADNLSKGKRDNALEDQIIRQERELLERSGAFSDFDKIKNIDWKVVRDGLAKDEVAIEFINFRSEINSLNPVIYAALLVKKGSEHPEVIKLCTEEELTAILGVFQGNNNAFVRRVYGKKSKSEKELYNKIWEPLNDHLEGIKKVYYSPSGLLHKVSFAALSNGDDMFLCDQYDLFQQSSTSKLLGMVDLGYSSTDNFILVGGVDYSSKSTENELWSYLPGTASETSAIKDLLKKKKHTIELLEGQNAKESRLKKMASSAAVLHLSTHGFFFPNPEDIAENIENNDLEYVDDMNFRGTTMLDSLSRSSTSYLSWNFVGNKNPLMRSGLVLAGANDVWQRNPLEEGEDGVLTAQEVSNLDLSRTKLVVLSACETGLGDIKGTEGVFGLQRAFKMAGASYLIMSLWQVPDNETAEFMKLFYKNLTKKKDIKTAFGLTQKAMRKKYDPYYWAAFVLIE